MKKTEVSESLAAEQSVRKKKKPEPYVTYEIMRTNKAVPIARPADFVTLTPVVIPMPVMPFTVQQPQPQRSPAQNVQQNAGVQSRK